MGLKVCEVHLIGPQTALMRGRERHRRSDFRWGGTCGRCFYSEEPLRRRLRQSGCGSAPVPSSSSSGAEPLCLFDYSTCSRHVSHCSNGRIPTAPIPTSNLSRPLASYHLLSFSRLQTEVPPGAFSVGMKKFITIVAQPFVQLGHENTSRASTLGRKTPTLGIQFFHQRLKVLMLPFLSLLRG